ncbi:hypothetical protein F5Y17DRAFT_459625 [Xylariaceae sp. FL0594]|nr:hypothetical protein F5Y17DRAFT_459625 [Xylariaceae sp. FL0594]
MSRFLIATTAVVTAVQGMAFQGALAKATQAVVPDVTFHRAEITPGPSVKEMVKRATNATVLFAPDNTCGYVSGRATASYTCGQDYTCGFVIEGSLGAVGCCTQRSCALRFDCVDYKQVYSQSACNNNCMQDTYTAKCTSTAFPYCGTVSFFSGIVDYYCAESPISTVEQLYTTYNGESDSRRFQEFVVTDTDDVSVSASGTDTDTGNGEFAFGNSDFNSFTDDVSSFTFGGGGGSHTFTPTGQAFPTGNSGGNGGSGGNSDGGGFSDNGDGGSKASSPPIGPIVGGVVGGVAALALIGLGIFFLVRRNRRNKNDAAAAATGAAAAGGPGPGQPPMQQQQQQPPYNGYPPQNPQQQPGQQPPFYGAPGTDQKPVGFVSMAPAASPDRHDSTSPVSQLSDGRYSNVPPYPQQQQPSPQPQQQQQPSPLLGVPPQHPQYPQAQSPGSPAPTQASSNWGPQPGQVVHEAGGNAIGGGPGAPRDYNAIHHGEFHELQ